MTERVQRRRTRKRAKSGQRQFEFPDFEGWVPDENGQFAIKGVQPGVYSLVVTGIKGFAATSILVSPARTPVARREWTDHTGTRKVVADLVQVSGDSAVLKKADGTIVTVPVSLLSGDDRH